MKKILFGFIVVLFSCTTTTKNKEYSTAEDAFNATKTAIEKKDVKALKDLTYILDLKYINYDSLLSAYNNLSIELIPETADGAFGVKKVKYNHFLYYTSFNENGIRKDVKVIQFEEKSDGYKIVNIAKVVSNSPKNEAKEEQKTKETKKQYARITTIADGYDVERVNLWSSTSSNREMNGFCTKNEKVEILDYSGEYVKVKKTNGVEGWCMKSFIKK